ncbi:phosphatidylinositol 4-phosphate 5-kinase-like protein 1 [Asterias rubens]|uniref:phosphatidylinositol 4-phosphate 5-kinase-like protein 1 n=1 Tax=Asterias rubens TaxID=7604 RepID=UPI00145586CF|nr:phosphatidylinositol 4-phosphate 5-kinase-like protein 1 [Asterias rubens]
MVCDYPKQKTWQQFRTPAAQPSHSKDFATLIGKAHHQWTRRGIIEINENHKLFELSRCIQMGIRECYDPRQINQGDVHLQDEDYQEEVIITLVENDLKKLFEFRSYAPKVFAAIRTLIGVTESDFLESLSPSSGFPKLFMEFITSSRSGMTFFLCNNKAFILKTEKYTDVCFLRKDFLQRLVKHFVNYPHSLLVKIVGCYFIKLNGSKGIYFTVMQSVFYPDDRITERYDLKGCSASRYVKPLKEESHKVIVLKDNNFEGKTIQIGAQKCWFIKQVEIDTKFLENQGVMDYSLILGVQILHADEKIMTDNLADVVVRARRSVKLLPESPNSLCPNCKRRLPSWNQRSTVKIHPGLKTPSKSSSPQDINETESRIQQHLDYAADDELSTTGEAGRHQLDERELLPVDMDTPDSTKDDVGLGETSGQVLPGMVTMSNSQGNQLNSQGNQLNEPPELRESNSSFCECANLLKMDEVLNCNQRLLPNTANPLHIIDGQNHRYFVGIIDVFTRFTFRKKMEHLYKCMRYPTQSFSTVRPEQYAKRFREFCSAKSE